MKIKVSASVTSHAQFVKQYIDTFSNEIKQLQALIDSIPQVWVGEDATNFIKKFNDTIFPELIKYESSFTDYQKYLNDVYYVYSALENDYNKTIE